MRDPKQNEKKPTLPKETEELLEQYKKQIEDAGVHSYSETFHHEYYDYSDSNHCCC